MKPRLSLKGRALQLLAQREQSRVELRRKLTAHALAEARAHAGIASEAADATEAADSDTRPDDAQTIAARVDEVLTWLEANQFSSDARFVESRVSARSARFGNLRIRGELSQHGVALGAEQAQQLRDTELDRALQVWERKFGAAQNVGVVDAAARARQSRFLAGRGFSPEVIRRVLRQVPR